MGRDADKFITEYLFDGNCSAIEESATYTEFRHCAATALSPEGSDTTLSPDDIKIVGSSKLGYSLNPSKDFREFKIEQGSDIDVAVFSDDLFQRSLADLRELRFYDRLNRKLIGQELDEDHYREIYILRSILYGFIPLDSILTRMSYGQQWSKARDELVSVLGPKLKSADINFRLYRSSEFLRSYQLRAVKKAITRLDSEA
ncbi:hypothetical protein [Corynebacterium sp. HMSC22B11]|uniref:hypothetical protein n=1 Tax=Corynebacterium sp. HMSC22B11 TaxID=1581056 RepID=UPI00114CD17A|nr:hypothetical protein [Corynebacterium sp. HMSC22B11]